MTSFHVLCLLASLISPVFSLVPLQPFTDSLAALQAAYLAWGTLLCFGHSFPSSFPHFIQIPAQVFPSMASLLTPKHLSSPYRALWKHIHDTRSVQLAVFYFMSGFTTWMWAPSAGAALICHAISSLDCWCGAGTLLGWKWMVLDLVSLLPWKPLPWA